MQNSNRNYRIKMVLGKRQHGKTGTVIRTIIPWYVLERYRHFGKVKIGIIDLEHNYNYEKFECLSDSKYPKEKKDILKIVSNQPVPAIPLEKFGFLKKKTVRLLPDENENADHFSDRVFNAIKNDRTINKCLLVVEDAARFMPDNNRMDSDLKAMCINAKQRDMDLCLVFHDWSDVPPKLIRWIDDIYLHKTDTTATYRAKDLGPHKLAQLLQAEKEVNNHPENFFHKHIILNE